MTTVTPTSQLKLLTPLPRPPNTPTLTSGTISLFADSKWTSQRVEVATADYNPRERQTIRSSFNDKASWGAFNLPVGTVATLISDPAPVRADSHFANLRNCGRCIDLVGTGKTESVDFMKLKLNDSITAWFWRPVELGMGAIELFDDLNMTGNRSTIFLSEWNPGTTYSLDGWYMNRQATSMRWATLNDRQTVKLFDNADGSGDVLNEVKGWGSFKEIRDLREHSFDDKIAAFRWDGVVPLKEEIQPFNIVAPPSKGASALTAELVGTNNTETAQPVTVSLNQTEAQQYTIATTDSFVTGISTTVTLSHTAGVKDVMSTTATWAITVNFSYTRTETRTTQETKTMALNISQVINAPPMSKYKASLLVALGKIPATTYTTKAERWYEVPVAGSKADPSNNGWYKRTENVYLKLDGTFASSTTVNIESSKIK